jgi:hypothetical protein
MTFYSIGSLAGPLPSHVVLDSLINAVNVEKARSTAFKDTVFPNDRNSDESIIAFVHRITTIAENWTMKRIEYLDAVRGTILDRDTRLFDHHP